MALELTESELENFITHNRYVSNLSSSLRTSPKVQRNAKTPDSRKQEAIELYARHGSIGYVCSELHIARNTLKNILEDYAAQKVVSQ